MERLAYGLRSIRPKWAYPLVQEPVEKPDFDTREISTLPWASLYLTALASLGFAASLVEYLQWKLVASLVGAIIWALALASLVLLRPRTFSPLLCILIITASACPVIVIAQSSLRSGIDLVWELVSASISLIALLIALGMPMRNPFLSRNGISRPFTTPTDELRSPEDSLSMWQWMTVSWMTPLIGAGNQRQLNDDDVWQLPYHFQHSPLHEAFRNLTGTVVVRLLKANWIDVLILTLLGSIQIAVDYSAPVVLQRLLQAMQTIDKDKKPAISWAALTLFLQFVSSQSMVFAGWYSRRAYERSRGAMVTMIHEKVLHRKILGGRSKDDSEKEGDSNAAEARSETTSYGEMNPEDSNEQQELLTAKDRKKGGLRASAKAVLEKATSCIPSKRKITTLTEKEPASMGKILNLMRNDVYETAQRFWEFQMLLAVPIGLVLSIFLIWRMIGWSSLIGIAVVVIAQIINLILARILLSWERVRRKATDHKLQQITQYVEAIRHLRWYGWHNRKLETVMDARQGELNLRIITLFWSNTIMFVNTFASGILPVAAFWAYTTLAGQELSIDIAFPALQLFTLLQANLRDVPNLIQIFLNAAVAVGRIEEFMSEPDVAEENTVEFAHQLELKNASFAWPGMSKNVLHQIDVVFPLGLSIVIGPVASGKTALLQAMLGELDLRGGQLYRLDTPVGYCAQTPWLESMTIRDNILFCSPYDETRYKHVLSACALLPDFATFKQGDMSPIGENGIGLSGGQKARVALARAVYSQAKILLLDDPLSALDQQTAEWIVAKCLSGSLVKDRIVVLVTHRTDLCQGISEQVVEMSDGQAKVYKDNAVVTNDSTLLAKVDSPAEEMKKSQEANIAKEKFEDEEFRAHGGIEFKVYWEYIKAGKLRWWALVIGSVLFWRLFDYGQNWFLKEWGEAYKSSDSNLLLILKTTMVRLHQASPLSRLFDRLPDPAINPKPWLFWYMILVILQAFAFLLSQLLMLVVTYTAGKNMFARIMVTISNATFRFYDVTPVGRLMNRLTGDVGTVDGPIASQFLGVAWEMVSWVSSIIIIASITPMFFIFALALTATFVYVFFQFLPTSQSLRRLEMVSLSPLMSNFGALLNGLVTVRAFHAQSNFMDRVVRVTDAFQKMDHFYWSLQNWLQYRFDNLSSVSTFLLTILAIYSKISPGLTAFLLIAAQRFVQSTYKLCKQYGQLQLDFVSVERVVELLHLEQEDPGKRLPPASWPLLASSKPAVEFDNVTVRYTPHHDPALNNISFSIPSGTSTAIIGRTGSGKSTMALALLATITPEAGSINIDGIDISTVSKQDLRTRITFLAQDPVLFQGNLRTNLDPMSDYTDAECSSVIARIHGDMRYNWRLDTTVEAGGKNLSQGQRQLVGLARAILRRSAVIIMDEATASVDLETSWEVQRVLKEELKGSTVITIAHRASAVRDCDFVVKLDKGRLVAFGKPEDVENDVVGLSGENEYGNGDVNGSGSASGSGTRIGSVEETQLEDDAGEEDAERGSD